MRRLYYGEKFILDLTKTQLTDWYAKCIKRIPIEKGRYGLDWDIKADEISAEDYQILKAACVSGYRTDIPIGFYNKALPIGTVIEVVE